MVEGRGRAFGTRESYMKLVWKISPSDIAGVQALVASAQTDALVRARVAHSTSTKRPLSKAGFWHALVGSLLTTQQRSGPESAVSRFQLARPFPLSYDACCRVPEVATFVTRTLSQFGGIRRTSRIGQELSANLDRLQAGLWTDVLAQVNSLLPNATQAEEYAVAEFLDDHLVGLGPKQSRNLLMGVGFTRYELPIDSRIAKWLNRFGFPVHLSSTALADRHYYGFVSQGIQQLCHSADILPSVFDAAVFASFDAGGWRPKYTQAWGYDGA